MPKRMRLPNGFGQISKLKQRLRNPYRAMVTESWTDEGKPVRKIIGYARTYNDAYQLLMEYHNDPYADKYQKATMNDLLDMWVEEYQKSKPGKYERNYASAWKYAEGLYKYQVKDIRSYHIKEAVEGEMPPSMHQRLHLLLNMMFDYAVQYNMTDKNYSRLAKPIYDDTVDDPIKHFAFTEEEISMIWKKRSEYGQIADMILVQIYMGWRPQELVRLENINVNTDEWSITGGLKTAAGKNRTVPVHESIRPIIEKYHREDGMLFGKIDTYNKYVRRFKGFIVDMGMNSKHVPHNPRVTFSTLCKKYNVDEYARKVMMGHKLEDLTDRVYTDLGIDWLHKEVAKIKSS